MTVCDVIIYDRYGQPLFHQVLNQSLEETACNKTQIDRAKLFFGLVFTIQSFTAKLNPSYDAQKSTLSCSKLTSNFSFNTAEYRLHFYSPPTGLKILVVTSLADNTPTSTCADMLKQIYILFVDYVMNTPSYRQGDSRISPIPILFQNKLKQLLESTLTTIDPLPNTVIGTNNTPTQLASPSGPITSPPTTRGYANTTTLPPSRDGR